MFECLQLLLCPDMEECSWYNPEWKKKVALHCRIWFSFEKNKHGQRNVVWFCYDFVCP